MYLGGYPQWWEFGVNVVYRLPPKDLGVRLGDKIEFGPLWSIHNKTRLGGSCVVKGCRRCLQHHPHTTTYNLRRRDGCHQADQRPWYRKE